MNTTVNIGSIYSYTNGFGYVSTIKIIGTDKSLMYYLKLLDNAEWSEQVYTMKEFTFILYKKIS